MLFHITFRPKAGYTHEDQKKGLALWANWQPPEGYEIKSFWITPDGRGFALVEADTAEALYEGTAPWSAVLLDYEIVPVVDADTGETLLEKAIAFREG